MKENTNNVRSVLAKLLAKENISVQHGNFSTAFFDVKSRVLGLPIWKDKGKDVYDMLVGHEVGHALYSPMFDPTKLPAPHSYVNVVEDIRIERKIQATYPGLVRCFQEGYATLAAEDFFGIKGKDVNTLSLPDRINLKAKLGNLVDIQFFPDEAEIVKQCFAVQTWQDTLVASEALYRFCKKQAEEQQKQKQQQAQESQKQQQKKQDEQKKQQQKSKSQKSQSDEERDPTQQPDIDPDGQSEESDGEGEESEKKSSKKQSSKSDDESEESEEDSSGGESGDSDGDDDEKSQSSGGDSDESDDDGEESESNGSSKADGEQKASKGVESDEESDEDSEGESGQPGSPSRPSLADMENPLDVNTDSNFAKQAQNLIDKSRDTLRTEFAIEPTMAEVNQQIVPYKELFANRDRTPSYRQAATSATSHTSYVDFMKATNKYVAMLKKEFDMRKAAYQYSRATVARSGVLNVDKLHSYRIDDDIFLSVSQLANAKNHGMVMFVDYSGSMSSCLPYVLKHLINMAVFCKAVNIPFRVYAFTSENGRMASTGRQPTTAEGRIIINGLSLLELVSSEMSKTDYNRAIKDLYLRALYQGNCGSYENLGSTPLNETLLAAHKIIKNLQSLYPVQKWISIFLTDGEGGSVSVEHNSNFDSVRSGARQYYGYESIEMVLNGRRFRSPGNANEHMKALIQNLRITTGAKVIGFFIPGGSTNVKTYAVRASASLPFNARKGFDEKEMMTNFRAEKSLSIPGAYNYDDYFIVSSGRDLDVAENDLNVTEEMSRGRIAAEFTDYSKSKKINRVFVTKFAEAIA